MEPDFWRERWEANQIGFHQAKVNRFLERYFEALNVPAGGRVFVPLCGKTLDMGWIAAQGCEVVGAELSELAVKQFYEEAGLTPVTSMEGPLIRYEAEGIVIWAGDIFDLSAEALGSIDAVYDRAALVALPLEMRARYAAHLAAITGAAPELTITFEYDQSVMNGPPFSISEDEIARCHAARFEMRALATEEVFGGLKGVAPATETAWLLTTRRA